MRVQGSYNRITVVPKFANILTFSLLVFFQLWFLGAALWEKTTHLPSVLFLSAVALLVIPAYFEVFERTSHHRISIPKNWYLVVAVAVGAATAYILNIHVGLGPVVAAALVGLLGSFLPKKLPPAIYCGSFVGMSSSLVLGNIWVVGLAGLAAGILYLFAENVFKGVGGKLGTIAFVGVALTVLILGF